jgi:hypothetical protein
MVLELDEHVDHKSRQDQVFNQTALNQTASPLSTRRQLIVE